MGYIFEGFEGYERDIEECAKLLLPHLPELSDPEVLRQYVRRYASLLNTCGYSFHEITGTFVRRDIRMMLIVYLASIGADSFLQQNDGSSSDGDSDERSPSPSATKFGVELGIPGVLKVRWENSKSG